MPAPLFPSLNHMVNFLIDVLAFCCKDGDVHVCQAKIWCWTHDSTLQRDFVEKISVVAKGKPL